MLLSVLLQAAAGAQVSQYWVQVSVSVKSVVLPWKLWHVNRKHQAICV